MIRPSRVQLIVTCLVLGVAVAACSGGSSGKGAAPGKTTTNADVTGASTTAGAVTTAAAVTTVPGPTTTTRPRCKAGLGTVAGVRARTFCGPATATVTVGTTPLTFAGGRCQSGAGYLTVNIGTVALGALKDPSQKPAYFGLVAGDLSKAPGGAAATADDTSPPIAGDGAYPGQPVITGNSGATAIVMKTAALTLSDGRRRGTFTGTGLDGQAVTGSFACR